MCLNFSTVLLSEDHLKKVLSNFLKESVCEQGWHCSMLEVLKIFLKREGSSRCLVMGELLRKRVAGVWRCGPDPLKGVCHVQSLKS